MKRFSKVLLVCVAGGLLLTVAFVLQVPSANADFPEITFAPFCVTVTLAPADPLGISAMPNWSHPDVGNQVFYRLYRGQTGVIIFQATINRPDALYTELPPELTCSGEYNHWAEYRPFNFRGGPFWVDRGPGIIP